MGNGFALALKPEIIPNPNEDPSFDPMLGFPNGRKKRGNFFCLNSLLFCISIQFLIFSDASIRRGNDFS
jgi:hypothetical protein